MIKILLIDDHQIARFGLRYVLSNVDDFDIVGEGCSGEEAMKQAQALQPDVILMDLKMPGMGGFEATRRILNRSASIKIIIITQFGNAPLPKQLLDAGACGYLLKNSRAEDIIDAIRTVCDGGYSIDPVVAHNIAVTHVKIKGAEQTPIDMLSDRELQVMLMLSDGQTTKEIANSLSLGEKTINTYRYRLYDKLQVHCAVALVRMAIEYGLIEL